MNPSSLGLAARLVEGAAPHAIRPLGPSADVRDTLARMSVRGKTEAELRWRDGWARVTIDRATREYAERHPDAVWLVDLRSGSTRDAPSGVAVPFRPPRLERLDACVPVVVPPSLVDRLKEVGLRADDDLARIGALGLGREDRVLVLGQRIVAALDDTDARRVTWWLPRGDAVELLAEVDDEGRLSLHVVDLVQAADATNANSGPNVLVSLGPGARAPLDPTGTLARPPIAEAPLFRPARSALFDAWARYTEIARLARADRERARGEHPVPFVEGGDYGGGRWGATARMSPEAQTAWLGPEAKEGRRVRVGQPVALAREDGDDGAQFTLRDATLRGPGVVELVLEHRAGPNYLPVSGTLEARTDRGEKVRLERERDAVDALGRGTAACERLPLLLSTPEATLPPDLRPLPAAPQALLDAHQEHAVRMILGCRELVAIQGPPGTGKTRVIAEALRQIAIAHPKGERPVRVLVSSVQNEAVSNVVERLAKAEGILVRIVNRGARDENEAFDHARRLDEQRRGVIGGLREKLGGSLVAGKLDRVRAEEDALDELRGLLAAGPEHRGALAARLRALAHGPPSLLSLLLREEAAVLADRLEAPVPEPPRAPSERSLPPLPPDPAEAPAWWAEVGDAWPVEDRAAVAMAVQALADALRKPAGARDLLLPRRWEAVRAAAGEAPPAEAPAVAPTPEDPAARADAWMASARSELVALRRHVEASPEAIALHFLRTLDEDPRAWHQIVQRHGNTVAATCSMAGKEKPDPGEAYDWVIVDEAGRASPFELLVPMVQGRRIVLIGDHRQLPPMVEEAWVKAAMEERTIRVDLRTSTLFGDLYGLLPDACRTRLGVQYRMHADIGDLVDQLFYRPLGEGLSSYHRGERAKAVTSTLGVHGNRPVVWEDVAPGSRYEEDNPEEAERIVTLVRQYARKGAGEGTVAIICPYARQRLRIERLLSVEPPEVKAVAQVKTIDAVQGREYPVVLLCLVRTDGRPGFLTSPNRLNVAVSRAQHQLVIVGSAARFLESDLVRRNAPQLRELIARVSGLEAPGGAVRTPQPRREGADG